MIRKRRKRMRTAAATEIQELPGRTATALIVRWERSALEKDESWSLDGIVPGENTGGKEIMGLEMGKVLTNPVIRDERTESEKEACLRAVGWRTAGAKRMWYRGPAINGLMAWSLVKKRYRAPVLEWN